MGLFDFLGGGPERALRKHAGRVADKRAQAPDRAESIRYLAGVRSAPAVEALLARFAYRVDPSIIDQEEKEDVFNAIVDAGVDVALEPVLAYFHNPATPVNWSLKILGHLVTEDELVDEIIGLLAGMDIEYLRDPERKQQLLAALEDLRSPKIVKAVLRFLEDVNETARFHAVGALLMQLGLSSEPGAAPPDEPVAAEVRAEVLDALARQLLVEESVRVRARIAGGLADGEHVLSAEREAITKVLPAGFTLDKGGVVRRKS